MNRIGEQFYIRMAIPHSVPDVPTVKDAVVPLMKGALQVAVGNQIGSPLREQILDTGYRNLGAGAKSSWRIITNRT